LYFISQGKSWAKLKMPISIFLGASQFIKMPFPPQFISSLQQTNGFDETAFIEAHQNNCPTSIRLNPAKPFTAFSDSEMVPWADQGRYLAARPNFTLDPSFHAGAYYVQEASSMFVGHALQHIIDPDEDYRVLDLCAAPGGKSTLISSLLSNQSVLVANEVIKNRASVLANNLSKWGKAHAYVSNNDPKDFQRLEGYFDIMMVDAPCSGSGMFRKDPNAQNEWSLEAVTQCANRQKRILADAWPCLAQDGFLIYSTCSYSEAENEQIANWVVSELGAKIVHIPVFEGITSDVGYRFWPDKIIGEGFYLVVLQKISSTKIFTYRYKKEEPNKLRRTQTAAFGHYIAELENYAWVQKNDDFFLIDKSQKSDFELFSNNLYLRKAGVRLGQMAGEDLIPDHELATSLALRSDLPCLELDLATAIKYLRKEDFELPPHWQASPKMPTKNWTIVRYQGLALGWIKVLQNRLNNYYPKDQRILMADKTVNPQ
jgi:16S rRNA C967 or C1407 C5-methylase (RsmB/RsmF family)/NOL1/NOP2/fmu family ribosome biogenesis protein